MKKSKLLTSLAAIGIAFLMLPQTVHAAGFVQDTTGVKYQNDDGSFLTNSWVQVGQNIYHLDANGIVQTGWIQVGNLWYLLDANGVCTNPAGTATPPADAVTPAVPVPAATLAAPAPAATPAVPAPAATPAINNIFVSAGWVPFQTTDATLLNSGVAAGLVGSDGTQYWAEPTFAAAAQQSAVAQATAAQLTQPEPAALTPQYVYLSATGKKYHRINNCGNMNPAKAVRVTLEEARNKGKTACSNCF